MGDYLRYIVTFLIYKGIIRWDLLGEVIGMMTTKRTGRLVVLAILCVLLCLAAPAMAATWVVNPDGTGDFTTIQAALGSDWTSGDTIEIAYAVYKEPVAVDADGGALAIMGIPSAAGDLPVIDGMNGTVDLPGLVDGQYGCGNCSMFLYNGDYTVSSLCVTNASNNGLVVNSYGDESTVSLTDIEALNNGNHGVNVYWCDKVVLNGIVASENGGHGINVYSDSFEGTDLLCSDNGRHGLIVWAGDVSLTYVDAFQNGLRGVSAHVSGPRSGGYSEALLTDMYVADNGWDGLFIRGSGPSIADIYRVESTGNGGDGVVLTGFDDFTASDLLLDGNGVGEALTSVLLADCEGDVSLSCADSVNGVSLCNKMDRNGDSRFYADSEFATIESENVAAATSSMLCDLRDEGNGLFVMNAGNGTIENVDATNNPSVGIVVDATGDVVISECSADANGYLGILATSLSDESESFLGQVLSDTGMDTESDETEAVIETAFTQMSASVADATVVSEDEFILGEGVSIFVDDIIEEGPDVTLSSVEANNNGYAGIGVIASYVNATDIDADGNGVSPTDVLGTLSGAGIVGASFVGEYSDIAAADNGGAGMAAASLVLGIEDATFTGNGAEAYSDIHGPLFQTGLLTVSLVNNFVDVHSDQNAGSGIIMTSVQTICEGCSANGNEFDGIVAVDPLSLGIAALLAHSDLSVVLDSADISEEDRFYLESLSTPAMQDVMTCYGETDAFAASAAVDIDIDIDNITEEDVAVLIEMLHQYMDLSGCYMDDSTADENGLFGMAVVYPDVEIYGFSADGNGNDSGSTLEALLGTGIFGLYLTGDFYDTSVSENTGAGMVTVGVVSEYFEVTADNNGYAGIVTIDPVTLAAAALGAYFVVLDDTGAQVTLTADSAETTNLEMHADITESAVVQEIVTTYYTGTASVDAAMNAGIDGVIIPEDELEILLEHIEFYFTYAGVYATDVSASGNGYPGFVAIGPNVVMDGVTADDNGAANDDESEIIGLAAGSGVIGLSIVGDYENIAASGNTGAGIATAGVVTDMTTCDADENGVGVVSLFIVGDCTEIIADENAGPGIVLAGINGTLTDSVAIDNAGPGILCVDPVAAALMYLVPVMSESADDAEAVSPETMALLCQLSGTPATASSLSDESETAWSLIELVMAHSSYEGDITEMNETEILDFVMTHYLTNAGMSVSDVAAIHNGWQGIVILSPSIAVFDVAASVNGHDGVSVISPWKAVDALGWEHPAEPVGAERLGVAEVYAGRNDGAGLAISGANGGVILDINASKNNMGLLLGDSDNITVLDSTFEANWVASVVCGGNEWNSIVPAVMDLEDGPITDPTGSCNNSFDSIAVDSGVAVFPNSTGNVFDDTFFDCEQEIAADISGEGPYFIYSMSGSWVVMPPAETSPWVHQGGCGIGVAGMGGYNTTVNVTYDYSQGFPVEYGEKLYPMWAVNETTPWDSWRFNPADNDKLAMTVGPMEVPVCCPASVPAGEFVNVMYIAPFWQDEASDDDPGHDAFVESLAKNKHGYLNEYGVFVPYAPGEAPGDVPVEETGDTPGDGTGDNSGDDTGTPQQSDAGGNTPAAAEVTATSTAATSTPIPTTTPAGVAPVIGALGILGLLAVIRRR